MTRSRTRTSYRFVPRTCHKNSKTYLQSDGKLLGSSDAFYLGPYDKMIESSGTIVDETESILPAKGVRVPRFKPGKEKFLSNISLATFDPMSLNKARCPRPCSHTLSYYEEVSPPRIGTRYETFLYRYETDTQYPSAVNLLAFESGSTLETLMNGSPGNTAGPFKVPDWYALQDSFQERCDQLIPSNQMLGEPMIECEIFKIAFKSLLNPTRAIVSLLELGKVMGKRYTKKNLGYINRVVRSDKELTKMFYAGAGLRQASRDASNALLTYSFGIRPAVQDVLDVFETHSKVSKRMAFLESYGGKFIRISASQNLGSDVSAPYFPSTGTYPNFTSLSKFCLNYDARGIVARIGGWGRVRENLNWKSQWLAYNQAFGLNKALGLAWELIPFSFVIDWFTNAQDVINNVTRPSGGGPFTEFRAFSASYKEETVTSLWMVPGISRADSRSIVGPAGPFRIATKHNTFYQRFRSLPQHQGFEVDFSSLGSFQLLHGGALILQRFLK